MSKSSEPRRLAPPATPMIAKPGEKGLYGPRPGSLRRNHSTQDMTSYRGVVGSGSATRCRLRQPAVLIIPAPTVTPVASSIRMNDPVVRFFSYGSHNSGTVVRSCTRPISLSPSSLVS
jgi:hypothetical protein